MKRESKPALFLVLILLAALTLAACTTPAPGAGEIAPVEEVVPADDAAPVEEEAAVEPTAEPAAEEPAPAEEAPAATEAAPEPTSEPVVEASATAMADPLIVLIDNDEGPITPANFNTFIGYYLVGWVYDPLFARDPNLEPVPALAESYTVSDDGLNWVVTLRDDVTWHDGEPFTADDVVFSYNFLIEAGRAPNLAAISTIEATGEHEVSITLSAANPFFLMEGLAGYFILPEHIWAGQEPISGELNQFQGQIGTGAYRLTEIVPGESYTFTANPDYFRGQPKAPTVIAKIVKDRTQQFNQLRAGEAHAVLSSVPPAQVDQIAGDEAISLAQGSDFFNYIFYLNGSRPPFDQPLVRQAIAKAIDAQTLVDIVMLGYGVELPLSWYHPELPWALNIEREYNPEAAMALLDEAGLVDSDGDGVREFNGEPTAFEILCDTNNPSEVRSTELIAGWLADVGLGATQRCLDIDTEVTYIWPNFVSVPDPDYDMAIWGWSSGPQFQRGFVPGLLHSDFGGVGWANLTGVADPEMDVLLDELVVNPDMERSLEITNEIQTRLAETLQFISLMSPSGNFAYRPEAYDDWVYVKGTGIMTVWSFLEDTP